MTNSRSLSWIDRGRWDVLLAAATRGGPVPTRRDNGVHPAATRSQPRSHTRSVPDVPPQPAPVAAPAPVVYPSFFCASSQLDDRLQALVAWIEGAVPCRAAFIADDNGLPVVEHMGAEQGHVAAASSILLMLASVRSLMRDSGGWLSLKMSSAVLNVVEVATQWGRFGIGVVTDDSLPHEFFAALSAAVGSAFHGDTSEGETT